LSNKVTLKIPRPLYLRLQEMIKGSDFSSVTEYVTFILRLVISEKRQSGADLSVEELEHLKDRLQNLGTF
jgi:Arc/MetJ-type ribon-helix-helix transcriptional regulator